MRHTDDDLEVEVDRIFSLFCSIDPLADTLGMTIADYITFLTECKVLDGTASIHQMQDVFRVIGSGRAGRRFVPYGNKNTVVDSHMEAESQYSGLTKGQLHRLSASPFALTVASQVGEGGEGGGAGRQCRGPPVSSKPIPKFQTLSPSNPDPQSIHPEPSTIQP